MDKIKSKSLEVVEKEKKEKENLEKNINDVPFIKEDVDTVAFLTATTFEDVENTAELVAYLFDKIMELELKITELEMK